MLVGKYRIIYFFLGFKVVKIKYVEIKNTAFKLYTAFYLFFCIIVKCIECNYPSLLNPTNTCKIYKDMTSVFSSSYP